ncbi:MAG TPA: CHAT domain-containing protein [Candidatus Methylacidiphilales bacterium]|jgi:CHAT domain-containing protein|nr:CHAT domain-containing protein [Candidatus Methylacidiphilales bacterium]
MNNRRALYYLRPIAVFTAVMASLLPATRGMGDPEQTAKSIAAAEEMTSQGNFAASLPSWRAAWDEASGEKDLSGQLTAALGLADALQELGQNRLAEQALETADALAKSKGTEKALQVRIESSLGALYMFDTNPDDAEGLLTRSLAMARRLKDAHLTATALNNLANLHVYQKKTQQALDEYGEAVSLAQAGGDRVLAAKISANRVECAVETASWDEAKKGACEIIAQGPRLPDTHDKAAALLSAGKACVDIFTQSDSKDDDLRLKAYAAYRQAEQTARKIYDDRALSYALGYQGELYQLEGRSDEALVLTRHAALLAQQIKSPDILFRWQWQIARIISLQRQLEPAITAYQSAVATLQTIRHDMSLHFGNVNYHSSFREAAGAVYFELADLLLQRADHAQTDAEIQADLAAARDTSEDLKAAELEDYFQDDCANLLKSKITRIETVSSTAAVIYIIPLPDRTEILVNMPSGRIERVKSQVTAAQLEETATAFRFNLEKRTTDEYLEQATQLYDWLIKPLTPLIDNGKIDTLVFVPDGALRTIPMAALSDGDRFLVEKYAIATTPGLTLMEPKPLTARKNNLIINGLSDGVQGFPPLTYVPDEVKKLNNLYGGPELMNAKFIQPNIDREFSTDTYSIVHIASHGHFDSDARKTFVLTYDGKLSLDQLERMIRPSQMRDQPVELLTLSACQTAAGDDRAALGLAGIAVKAGARSAFATLWFVNDEASSMLVGDFYANLHNIAGISKAKALQKAQIKLLSDPRYGHPCYWAPYLIIGNWL